MLKLKRRSIVVALLILLCQSLLCQSTAEPLHRAYKALQQAVASGTAAHVRSALARTTRLAASAGEDEDADAPPWLPLLIRGVVRGNPGVVRQLLRAAKKRPRFDVNAARLRRGGSVLHAAAFAGNDKVVKQLMAVGADPSILDASGLDAAGAAMRGWAHRFRNLHDQPTQAAERQNTFVGTAKSFNRGLAQLVKRTTVTGDHILHATRLAWADGLATLLKQVDHSTVVYPPQLVSIACDTISLTILLSKFLVNHGNVAVDPGMLQAYPDSPRISSFDFIGLNALPMIRSSTSASSYESRRALDNVFFQWHSEHILKPLLQADTALLDKSPHALHMAATNGNAPALSLMLASQLKRRNRDNRSLLEARDKRGRTPLMAAYVGGYAEAVEVLIEAGADATTLEEVHVYPGNVSVQGETRLLEAAPDSGGGWGTPNTVGAHTRSPTSTSPPSCSIDVMESWNASVFRKKYLFSGTPVLLRNHPTLHSWQAKEAWRKPAFVEHLANTEFSVYGRRENDERATTFSMTLAEFLRQEQEQEQEPYWLVATDTGREESAVVEFLTATSGRFLWYEEMLRQDVRIDASYNNFQFMISPEGVGASPHFHNSALNALIFGRKTWFLFPPHKAVHTTKHVLAWYHEDYRQGEAYECTQQSGDILFVPDTWGHAVIADQLSIGMAHLYNG
jgi:ankyrin repeat protein